MPLDAEVRPNVYAQMFDELRNLHTRETQR